jgi:hypothetical protein
LSPKELFTITHVCVRNHDSSFGGYKWRLDASVSVDAKYWHKLNKTGNLGNLYGIDIGNKLARDYNLCFFATPMVDDSRRAKAGIKSITLTYFFKDDAIAESLDVKFKTKLKDCWISETYGGYTEIRPK